MYWKNDRLVIPDDGNLRLDFLHEAHDAGYAGHIGIDRTLAAIDRAYWWPGLRKDVRTYVLECDSCQRNKPVNMKPAGKIQPIPVPDKPWSDISMDLITDLPETDDGFDSVAVYDAHCAVQEDNHIRTICVAVLAKRGAPTRIPTLHHQ
jgi:hypothetical protein